MFKNKYIWLLYSSIVYLGAFLMFLIQPVVGKIITPQYGGVSQIWCLCLLFFQVVLLGGYGLAYLLSKFSLKIQGYTYAALMIISIFFIQIPLSDGWMVTNSDNPTFDLLLKLTSNLAFPVVMLSTVSVIAQNWYRLIFHKNPYHLFSISNLGAFTALLSYPFFIEPNLTVSFTVKYWIWSYWFIVTAVCIASVLLLIANKNLLKQEETTDQSPPLKTDYLSWFALSAAGTILLTSFTQHLTQDIAPVPLLWIIPLALYLMSFVLSFGRKKLYYRQGFIVAGLIFTLLFFILKIPAISGLIMSYFEYPIIFTTFLTLTTLFLLLMICHGELYESKPNVKYLSKFYLIMAFGGAFGGFFVNIIAPNIFNDFLEYKIIALIIALYMGYLVFNHKLKLLYSQKAGYVLTLIIISGIIYGFLNSLFINYNQGIKAQEVELLSKRNFYGVAKVRFSRVAQTSGLYLVNGTTIHGVQLLASGIKQFINKPVVYHINNSAYAIAYKLMKERRGEKSLKIGNIGLGIATIAYYGKSGDEITFYEIDPKIVDIATKEFGFIKDSKAKINIIVGDGRLSLKKQPPQNYDILLIDAFNSDAVPVHLLTREAIQLYLSHLKPDGVLLFHLSNKYVDFSPVINNIAQDMGLNAIGTKTRVLFSSNHITLSRENWFKNYVKNPIFKEQYPNTICIDPVWTPNVGIWTDDYSNILTTIKKNIVKK